MADPLLGETLVEADDLRRRVTELAVPGEATFGAWSLSASLGEQPQPGDGEQVLLDADRLAA